MEKGETYIVRPTILKAWSPKIKPGIYDGKLISIFKYNLVFLIDDIKYRMPQFAVEVMQILNNLINKKWLIDGAKIVIRKYVDGGFSNLSTDELRLLLAWQIYHEVDNLDFALNTVTKFEPCYIDRGDIIRSLRNSYHLRDTKDDKEYYKSFLEVRR